MIDPSTVLRQSLLGLSRSTAVRSAIEKAPVSRDVVRRFVPGTSTEQATAAAADLAGSGRLVTLDFLGEDTTDAAQAARTRDAYLGLLAALAEHGLTEGGRAEVSVKLSAVGQFLPADGERVVLRHLATDRAIFARGALRAALWGQDKAPGEYGMDDVLGI